MAAIKIEAQNPLDLEEQDFEDYVEAVKGELPEIEINSGEGQRMPAGARGVTWWEVLRVYISDIPDEVKGYVIGKLLDKAYDWAKLRFKKHPENKRPKCVVIHGADGKEEGSIVLESAEDKPTTTEEAMNPKPAKRTTKSTKSSKTSKSKTKRKTKK
jgi:hypothetical protein